MRGRLAALLFSVTTTVAAQPAQSTVAFRSDLPPRYRLESVRISIDGYIWADGPVAMVAPGVHDVAVAAEYTVHARTRGRDVRFEARSVKHMTALPKSVVVARAVEVGVPTDPPDKRVRIVWP